MFALVTSRGTAAAETALCESCFRSPKRLHGARLAGSQAGDIVNLQTFHDGSENDALKCRVCGARKGNRGIPSPLLITENVNARLIAAELAERIYEYVLENSESFKLEHTGEDLAYLLGAILKGAVCSWPASRPIVQLLQPIWERERIERFIKISGDD